MLTINSKNYKLNDIKSIDHRYNNDGSISFRQQDGKNYFKSNTKNGLKILSTIPEAKFKPELKHDIKSTFNKFHNFKFTDNKELNSRNYNINLRKTTMQTTDVKSLLKTVSNRLQHALKTGFSASDVFIVVLTLTGLRGDDTRSTRVKGFKLNSIRDFNKFIQELKNYTISYFESSNLVSVHINNISIRFIQKTERRL
jgi:hypothetical protein